ncbi:MAG: iron-containing alcohol dehydrogenase [Desulfosarcinaceae bacterium]
MEKEVLFNLRKFLAPEIVYGEGALELAGRHAMNLGAGKVLIVTDPGVQAAGWPTKVEACLEQAGIPFVTFNGVTPNPKDYEVMSGADVYQQEGCDLIIAVGGGSPMDCAKGIGVLAGNPGSIIDFEGVHSVPNPGPPLIFIPTTAGTSADVSQFAIITDTSRYLKIGIVSKMVIPEIALVDPRTTLSMPPQLTAETGMDAFCHACEAFVSTACSPLTDMAALSAAQLIVENLPGAVNNPGDMTFRNNMMMASLMAGLAFSNASLGLVHAMAHSLGGTLDLTHGECNAILLEKVVAFNYTAAPEKYDQLARSLGVATGRCKAGEKAQILAERLASFRESVGIRRHLADMGVSASDIPRLAGFASKDPCLATNPRPASSKEIERIFMSIFS